jgi:hypothetical protein
MNNPSDPADASSPAPQSHTPANDFPWPLGSLLRPGRKVTLLDEIEFAKEYSFEICGSVRRADLHRGYLDDRDLDIGRLMSVFDHGKDIGRDLYNEAEYRSEKSPTRDDLLRWYFNARCAGKDVRAIFRHPGDVAESDDFPYDSGWHWLYGRSRKGKFRVTNEIVLKANSMALDACRLMSRLTRGINTKPERDVILVAKLGIRNPTGALTEPFMYVEAHYDYLALDPGNQVFIGAYEITPFFSASEVRRHAGINHWGARAYLGKLLASAFFGLPAEWRYVVTCSNPCEFGYVNAYATSTDDLKFSYSEGAQEGPYLCRAYDVSSSSLEEGRIALNRALYRLYYQGDPDAIYLSREAI